MSDCPPPARQPNGVTRREELFWMAVTAVAVIAYMVIVFCGSMGARG